MANKFEPFTESQLNVISCGLGNLMHKIRTDENKSHEQVWEDETQGFYRCASRMNDEIIDVQRSRGHLTEQKIADEDMIIVNCTYTSVWDDDTSIETNCKYNVTKRLAFDIEATNVEGVDSLTDEYVDLPDGTRIQSGDFKCEGQEDEE